MSAAATALALQGCAQCADAVRGTSGAMQSAYARSIVLLMIGGGGVFAACVWMLMRDDR